MKSFSFNYVLYLFCILSAFASCGQKGENNITDWDRSFGDAQKLVSKSCLDRELILGRPYLIQYADSSLLIYDDIGDSLFLLVDLKENNRVYRFGQRGEGSNEFLQVFNFCHMKSDSILGVYDAYKHDLREINLGKVKRGEIDFPVLFKDTLSSIKLFPTQYDTYLGLGFYENNMLSLTGNAIGSKFFFEYPYKDSHEKAIPNRLRGMAYQGTLCSNQSLDKFLYIVHSAPIFTLYSVKKDRIEKTYEWIGGYPDYTTEETGEYRSAPMSADNIISFIMAYATDNYIYLLYSGKSIREAGANAFKANTIYRLSWDGKPMGKFELDYPLTNFCVSDNDDIMYALADKGEAELVQYALK
ncbi:MAG: TolB-like 6-bladed beta-propeller domain-containing protein [Bacteroides sp.]|nr:TolB-like 6-bladed beta-propeller domain-containing protein [Bacteroides sp.]